ncbi:MAG: hypothetical protein P8Y97_18585, partial [Candidatus Lokiarchaeota archaeon]
GNNFYYSFYNPDTDGDGLSDELELGIGTNPSLYDTDGDNFGDGYEYYHGTDPLDPNDYPGVNSSSNTGGGIPSYPFFILLGISVFCVIGIGYVIQKRIYQ